MSLRSPVIGLLAVSLLWSAPAGAEGPEGRARTWEFGITAGSTVIDSGFDAKFFGFTVPRNIKTPEKIDPDNLDTVIPTIGVRAQYNMTRFFGVELNLTSGSTDTGDGTAATVVPDLTIPFSQRQQRILEQKLAIPGIKKSIASLDWDYLGGSLTGVFSFNNRPTSKWVFHIEIGGGGFSLNPDTKKFNECRGGAALAATAKSRPDVDPFDFIGGRFGDPNNAFPDNPQQIATVDPGCDRAFPVAFEVKDFVNGGTKEELGRVRVLNSSPVLIDPNGPIVPSNQATDPVTGEPLWVVPPGKIVDTGFRLVNPVEGRSTSFFTAGGGVTWYFKPRQAFRIDARRHFAESINKNINEITVGYTFIVGHGKRVEAAVPAAAPVPAPDEVPPPAGDEEGGGGVDGREGVSL